MEQQNAVGAKANGPHTVDVHTVSAIRQVGWIALAPVIVLGALLVFGTIKGLVQRGVGEAVLTFLLGILLCGGVLWIYNRLVLRPAAALRYMGRAKAIVAALPSVGIAPTMLHSWRAPTPGAIALDRTRNLLFVQGEGTGHQRLVLEPRHIVGVKVERETELHTQTRHSGRIGLFSSSGAGYMFGGKSRSKTTAIERAFLEIHYQFDEQHSPGWVAVPFAEQRRDADAMAAAIQGMLQR